jgi:hypothetical protein
MSRSVQKITDADFVYDSGRLGKLNRQSQVTTVAPDAAADATIPHRHDRLRD